MLSPTVQYIIVFVILAVIAVWTVISLIRNKHSAASSCIGCSLAENCKKYSGSTKIRKDCDEDKKI